MARLSMDELRARRGAGDDGDKEARAALRKLTDKLVIGWKEKYESFPENAGWWPDLGVPDPGNQGDSGYTYYTPKGEHGDRCIWTTRRMFDGKFWAMRYSYHATGVHKGRYVLVKSSLRRRAKRKDAKEIAVRYFTASEVRA